MTKSGTYKVSDVRPSKDGSFRSMICAMLVFMAMCGIIILISWLLRPSNTNGTNTKLEHYPYYFDSNTGDSTKEEKNMTTSKTTTEKTTPSYKVVTSKPPDIQTEIQKTTPQTTTTPETKKVTTTESTTTPKVTTPKISSIADVTTSTQPSSETKIITVINATDTLKDITTMEPLKPEISNKTQPEKERITVTNATEKPEDVTTMEPSRPEITTATEHKIETTLKTKMPIITTTPETKIVTVIDTTKKPEDITTMIPLKPEISTITQSQPKVDTTTPLVTTTPETKIVTITKTSIEPETPKTENRTEKTHEIETPLEERKSKTTTIKTKIVVVKNITEKSEDVTTMKPIKPETENTTKTALKVETPLEERKPIITTTPDTKVIPVTNTTEKSEDTTTMEPITSKIENITETTLKVETPLEEGKSIITTTPETKILAITNTTEKIEETTTIEPFSPEIATTERRKVETTSEIIMPIITTTPETKIVPVITNTTEKLEETTTIEPFNPEIATTERRKVETTTEIIMPIITTTPETKIVPVITNTTEKLEETTTIEPFNPEIATTTERRKAETTSEIIIPIISTTPETKILAVTNSTEKPEDTTTMETFTPEIINRTQSQQKVETTTPLNKVPLVTTTPETKLVTITEASDKTEDTTTMKPITQETENTTKLLHKDENPNYSAPSIETFVPEHLTTQPPPETKCASANCKTVSSQILAQMNHHVEKCDSFYDYACGGLQIENSNDKIWQKVSENLENIDSESCLFVFKNYYDKCLDHHILLSNDKRIKEVKKILNSTVSSNIPDNINDKELTKLFATLMLNDYAPIFDVTVDISNDTKLFQFQLSLGQEKTILQDENYKSQTQKKCMIDMKAQIAPQEKVNMNSEYMSYLKCKTHDDEYIQNVIQAAKYLDLDLINNDDDFKSKLTSFLSNFKNLPPPEIQRTDVIMKKYELKSISQLKSEYPLIQWDDLFLQLVGKKVDNNELVQVYFGSYLKKWLNKLNTEPKPDLYKILYAMFANNLYRALVVPSSNSIFETEKLCLKQSSKLLKEIASHMYLNIIKEMDLDSHVNEINNIFNVLKQKFTETLKEADWLKDDESQESVINKLQNMALITNMVVWTNESIIEDRMLGVPSNMETYQIFSIKLIRRYRKMIYRMWKQPADNPEHIWWYYQTVYSEKFLPVYALNKIVISPVKLLEFHKDIPEYIRLSKLYYLLGKAIGHHFDNTGIQYDVELTYEAEKSYEELKICSSNKIEHKQSILFKGKKLEYQIKNSLPTLSLNNRIAEDIALKLTYDLSSNFLSEKKIIWLSDDNKPLDISYIAIAQEHCTKSSIEEVIIQLFESEELPAPILLKTILPNLETFNDVIECPEGSTMSDQQLCPAFQDLELYEEKK